MKNILMIFSLFFSGIIATAESILPENDDTNLQFASNVVRKVNFTVRNHGNSPKTDQSTKAIVFFMKEQADPEGNNLGIYISLRDAENELNEKIYRLKTKHLLFKGYRMLNTSGSMLILALRSASGPTETVKFDLSQTLTKNVILRGSTEIVPEENADKLLFASRFIRKQNLRFSYIAPVNPERTVATATIFSMEEYPMGESSDSVAIFVKLPSAQDPNISKIYRLRSIKGNQYSGYNVEGLRGSYLDVNLANLNVEGDIDWSQAAYDITHTDREDIVGISEE